MILHVSVINDSVKNHQLIRKPLNFLLSCQEKEHSFGAKILP